MTQRYRLEFRPTDPPRPMALWDCENGLPGSGGILVVVFGAHSTMKEAKEICDEMNKETDDG